MIRKFETQEEEIITILAEECAELIQEIMKMKRKDHYASTLFEEEIADVICMIQLAEEQGMFDMDRVRQHIAIKKSKLEKWSNIFENRT